MERLWVGSIFSLWWKITLVEKVLMKKCKRCKKEKDIVKDYIICWDCLIELDINHKNYKRYRAVSNGLTSKT